MVHVASLLCIRRLVPLRIFSARNLDAQCGKRLLGFGGAVFGGSLISMLFSPFNKLMLARYVGVASIPVYEIAFASVMQVRALVDSGVRPLMPEISRLNGLATHQARDRMMVTYRRVMKLILFTSVPGYATLAILAPALLRVWRGQGFVEGLPTAFRIMLLGSFVSLFSLPAYHTLMGMGRVEYTLGAHVVQAVANLVVVVLAVSASRVTVNTVVIAAASGMASVALYLGLRAMRVIRKPEHEIQQAVDSCGSD
jgi:O-antigen/teichoic acid export membrane protein